MYCTCVFGFYFYFTVLHVQPNCGPTGLKQVAYMQIYSSVILYLFIQWTIPSSPKCPDLLCGPPNLLLNWKQVSFRRGGVGKEWRWPLTSIQCWGEECVKRYLYSTHMLSWSIQEVNFFYLLVIDIGWTAVHLTDHHCSVYS